jgi:Serine incorporator (Serinc)
LSTQPAGLTSGRKRSVALVFLSICLQLVFQFAFAPYILDNLPSDHFIRQNWLDGCQSIVNERNDLQTQQQQQQQQRSCVSIAGNFRVAAATTVFFLLAAIVAYCKPTANREAWPAKIILYLMMVVGTVVLPNEPFFTPIYFVVAIGTIFLKMFQCLQINLSMDLYSYSYSQLHIFTKASAFSPCRINTKPIPLPTAGGVVFICLQQIVILDCSYNWNDSWYVMSFFSVQHSMKMSI